MDDEQKQLQAVDRAAKAEALLNNELLQEAFAYIDEEMIGQWRACTDPAGRDRIWLATQIAKRIQDVLKQIVTNGRASKIILDDLEAKRT